MQVRWGIIGPGKIARKFADALTRAPGNSLRAVASRELSRAEAFAKTFGASRAYGDYEQLARDEEVDVVYVATPHAYHKAHSIISMQHGKAVLCEKPMSVNYASTQAMVDVARAQGVFLMEAFWTRFMPLTLALEELLKRQAIGELKYVRADFGVAFDFDAESRIFNLHLGGGSLLDVGVYPLFLALLFLGKPRHIKSVVVKSKTGSDDLMNAMLTYENGCVANVLSSTYCKTPQTADIIGTTGSIHIPAAWWKAKSLALTRGNETINVEGNYPGNGYEFEIAEVQRCLADGKKESDLLPLSFSLLMSEVTESILKQHGITYEG
ncbi:MAG: Gfo/Idh/MocA family protein [Cyclobacteriaceae bacterium]